MRIDARSRPFLLEIVDLPEWRTSAAMLISTCNLNHIMLILLSSWYQL